MTFRNQIGLTFLVHLKTQRQRFIPEATDVRGHFDQIIEHQRLSKVEMNLHARQPDIKSIEDVRVRQAYGSEEFSLGDLEKSKELTVINNPGAIGV